MCEVFSFVCAVLRKPLCKRLPLSNQLVWATHGAWGLPNQLIPGFRGAHAQWNFTITQDSFKAPSHFMPWHALSFPPSLYKSDPPLAILSGTRNWSWRSHHRGVRLDNLCYILSHSISSLPCVYKTVNVLLLYVCLAIKCVNISLEKYLLVIWCSKHSLSCNILFILLSFQQVYGWYWGVECSPLRGTVWKEHIRI